MDTLFLGYSGSPSQLLQEFRKAAASLAPGSLVHVLAPGEPLAIQSHGRAAA
jgi:hypothetical protein